jgi:hypothetical protein
LIHRKVLAEPQKFLIKNVSSTAFWFWCGNSVLPPLLDKILYIRY